MSFIQKARKLLQEFPNLKNEPFQVKDKKKKSFLQEADKIFRKLVSFKNRDESEQLVSIPAVPLESDEEDGIIVDLDSIKDTEELLPQIEEGNDESEKSGFNPTILEDEAFTQDLLESEKILKEKTLETSSLLQEEIEPDEENGIVIDLDSMEDTDESLLHLDAASDESEKSEFVPTVLEDETFTQDLLKSEKILNEDSQDELVEVSSLEDFGDIKSDLLDEFSGNSETVDLTEESKLSLLDESHIGNSDEDNKDLDLVDDSGILEDWEKDAMTESMSDSSFLPDKEKAEEVLSELEEETSISEEPIIDVNVEDAFESAKQFKSSYEEKLEGYLVLFEITKELLKSTSFDDFFENLMYSIIGQVGPEIMIIFSSRDGNFSQMKIVAYEGIDIEPDYIIKRGDTLYSLLESEHNIVYPRNLLSNDLKERERILLENPLTEIIIPIRVMDQFSGFIVAGKMISGEEYTEKDFEFLQILVEVSGNFLSKLFDYEILSSEISELNKIINSTSNITDFTNEVYVCKTLDELYDVISENFLNDFKVSSFTFMILDIKTMDYKVFGSNFLLPETLGKLRLSKDSKIITMISQISDVYRLENYQSNGELNAYISEQELEAMNEFTVIPLINIGRMVGLFIIHKVSTEWSPGFKRTILSLSNIIAPIVANLVMQNEKESLFRNPFNPLQETIDREIIHCETKDKQFTLIVLKILNVTRILNILGINFFSEYSEFISKKIFENTKPSDYISRIGQGKFAILLKENSKVDSEVFVSKIKSEIVLFHNPSRDFKLSIQIYSLTYPDQAKDKRKFIEMMEET